MTAKSRYDAEFLRFMSFLDSREYNSLDQISSERIIMLKPNDICRYLNVKAYGTPTPHQDDHPSHARSNTLKALKKMLSKYMPRNNMQWDDIGERGNPTRSKDVNDLIKRVMKAEVRRLGKPPRARRPLSFSEFILIMNTCIKWNHLRIKSTLSLQWQLIGSVDDMMKLRIEDVKSTREHKQALEIQVRWSKNI